MVSGLVDLPRGDVAMRTVKMSGMILKGASYTPDSRHFPVPFLGRKEVVSPWPMCALILDDYDVRGLSHSDGEPFSRLQ